MYSSWLLRPRQGVGEILYPAVWSSSSVLAQTEVYEEKLMVVCFLPFFVSLKKNNCVSETPFSSVCESDIVYLQHVSDLVFVWKYM